MKRTLFLLIALIALMGVWFFVSQDGFGLWDHGGQVLVDTPSGMSAASGARDEERDLPGGPSGDVQARTRVAMDAVAEDGILGRVVDELADPVAGATVLLRGPSGSLGTYGEGPILARTSSDAKGRFDFRGLAHGSYLLQARAEGRAEKWREVVLLGANREVRDLTVRLPASFSVEGQVVDRAGKGLAGAWVLASWFDRWSPAPTQQEVRSDGKGRFVFEALPAGRIPLLVWSQGHELGLARVDASRSDRVRIDLAPSGPYQMSFALADSSKKEARSPTDVTVLLKMHVDDRLLPLPTPIRRLRIPAQGSITVQNLCAGEYAYLPRSETSVLQAYEETERLDRGRPAARITLTWTSGTPLEGRLVYEDGKPATGVGLQVWNPRRESPCFARTDRKGHWVFPARFPELESVQIRLTSPGLRFPDHGILWRAAQAYAGERENVLTVYPSPILSGRVVDEDGSPLSGAYVWLHGASDPSDFEANTYTDHDGRFRISRLTPTGTPLVLNAHHGFDFSPKPIPVERGSSPEREAYLISLIRGGSVGGRIVDGEGHGIAGVRVLPVLQSLDSNLFLPEAIPRTVSDKEGRFRVRGLRPGSWKIHVQSHDLVLRGLYPVVRLRAGESRDHLRLVMQKGLSIRGHIQSGGGQPLAGVEITARLNEDLPGDQSGAWASTESRPDGSFECSNLRPGVYGLEARVGISELVRFGVLPEGTEDLHRMWSQQEYRRWIAAGSKALDWKLHLPRFGGLRVALAQGKRPLKKIRIELRAGQGPWVPQTPIVGGLVSLENLLVGSYDLRFVSPWYEDLDLRVQVYANQVHDLGQVLLVNAPLLKGRVVDPEGKPLAGAWIGLDAGLARAWATSDPDRGPEQFKGRVLEQSDAQGSFRIPVKKATRIQVYKRGYVPGVRAVGGTKPEKPVGEVVLILARAGELRVETPARPKGMDWVSWSVRLQRVPVAAHQGAKEEPWTRSLSLRSSDQGLFLGLRPGRYRLSAKNDDKLSAYRRETLSGKCYYQELQIQAGSNLWIQIP